MTIPAVLGSAMTSRTAVLLAIAVVLAFLAVNLHVFSLIDRSTAKMESRVVLRDAKSGGVIYNCFTQKPTRKARK